MLGYFEVRPNARIEGSSRLWAPFQDPVAAWRAKPSPKRVLPIHPAGKRIDGRRHSHQEPTIVKREYEPQEPGIEGRMDSNPRLDVRKDGYAEEVKTVQPRTDDSDENWEKYKGTVRALHARRELQPGLCR